MDTRWDTMGYQMGYQIVVSFPDITTLESIQRVKMDALQLITHRKIETIHFCIEWFFCQEICGFWNLD